MDTGGDLNNQRYWFPVKPPGYGWGWGLPLVWQGWLVYAVFLSALVGGVIALAPLGQLAVIAWGCLAAALFVAVVAWKGEPRSRSRSR